MNFLFRIDFSRDLDIPFQTDNESLGNFGIQNDSIFKKEKKISLKFY